MSHAATDKYRSIAATQYSARIQVAQNQGMMTKKMAEIGS
jgi:hypothetical protein